MFEFATQEVEMYTLKKSEILIKEVIMDTKIQTKQTRLLVFRIASF
jgi:hypothetical protein